METNQQLELKGIKRLFLKKGSCSRALGFILDREFGHLKDLHEHALDPLAGGIAQQGYQCGMLWGSALGVGAESFRRGDSKEKAIALAIHATQHIMESFKERAKFIDCEDICNCDWNSKSSVVKHIISGKVLSCFTLMQKWAPEAIQAAYEGLSKDQNELPEQCLSCASEVAKKMGASEEEMTMVAGFAGGIGLSGGACGALAAAMWMKTMTLIKEQPGKTYFNHPEIKGIVEEFYRSNDYKILCTELTEKHFTSLDDHTDYIRKGGCERLINELAKT